MVHGLWSSEFGELFWFAFATLDVPLVWAEGRFGSNLSMDPCLLPLGPCAYYGYLSRIFQNHPATRFYTTFIPILVGTTGPMCDVWQKLAQHNGRSSLKRTCASSKYQNQTSPRNYSFENFARHPSRILLLVSSFQVLVCIYFHCLVLFAWPFLVGRVQTSQGVPILYGAIFAIHTYIIYHFSYIAHNIYACIQ